MYVEVRGQFAKVSSLLALCEAWGGIQGIRPDNNFLYLLSHPRKVIMRMTWWVKGKRKNTKRFGMWEDRSRGQFRGHWMWWLLQNQVENTVTELKLRVEWVREGNDIGLALVSLFEDHSFSISLVACSWSTVTISYYSGLAHVTPKTSSLFSLSYVGLLLNTTVVSHSPGFWVFLGFYIYSLFCPQKDVWNLVFRILFNLLSFDFCPNQMDWVSIYWKCICEIWWRKIGVGELFPKTKKKNMLDLSKNVIWSVLFNDIQIEQDFMELLASTLNTPFLRKTPTQPVVL